MEFKKLSAVEAVASVSDTASVLIEEDGVIKRAPKGEVGGVKVASTAEVGQTIVVKAVDEAGNPTEWECADLPSGGEEPDMVITLTSCPVWGIISTDVVTITSGTYADVVDKIWSGMPVDIRVRGTVSEGSYLADANEVKATATFYGGALWIKWVCSSLVGDRICYRMIKFLEDGSIEAITNRTITGTEE